jgi:hypothetical protein
MERWVCCVTENVKKGLPLTRKNLKFEEGRSKVTLRSLKEDILWVFPLKDEAVLIAVLKNWGKKVI